MFDCKVCAEKEKRIDDLLAQVDTLKRMLFPTPVSPSHLPVIDLDAGGESSKETPPPEIEDWLESQREADRILSGNY